MPNFNLTPTSIFLNLYLLSFILSYLLFLFLLRLSFMFQFIVTRGPG